MLQQLFASELFLKAQTDERLVALGREGHTRAFGVLVDRHRRALLAHAGRLVGPQRGEDVLQQGLLNAWRSLQDGVEVHYAQAWLHRIVHNAALTDIEHQPRNTEPLDLETAGPVSPASAAEQRYELLEVLRGVAELPQRERLALLGTELDGRSRRQLADELGLSEGAVRQLVYRARQRVRAGVAVLVPFPFLLRAGRAWARAAETADRLPGAVQAAGGSGVVAGGIKVAAVTVVAGAIGGAAVLHVGARHPAAPTAVARVAPAGGHAILPRPAGPVATARSMDRRESRRADASAARPAVAPPRPSAGRVRLAPGAPRTPARPAAPPATGGPVSPVTLRTPEEAAQATAAEASTVETGTAAGDGMSAPASPTSSTSLDESATTTEAAPTTSTAAPTTTPSGDTTESSATATPTTPTPTTTTPTSPTPVGTTPTSTTGAGEG